MNEGIRNNVNLFLPLSHQRGKSEFAFLTQKEKENEKEKEEKLIVFIVPCCYLLVCNSLFSDLSLSSGFTFSSV